MRVVVFPVSALRESTLSFLDEFGVIQVACIRRNAVIVKTGRWYLLSSVMTKALALITLTILTHNLSPADFGALNALVALTQAFPIVLSLYLDSALARLYHEYQSDRRQLTDLRQIRALR